jgi:hypothetical protein
MLIPQRLSNGANTSSQVFNDWNEAFNAAGFKNAIIGKEWPENDSSMSWKMPVTG